MPANSLLPAFEVPKEDIFGFLFERKDLPFSEDKVILRDGITKRSYTFAQTKAAAVEFGKGLRATWDWQKGDVLALFTPNCIDTPPIMWGCHWAGGVLSPANPGYTVDEFTFQLKDAGAKAIVTQKPLLDVAVKAAENVGIPKDRIVLMGDERDSEYQFKHFTSIRNLSGTSRYRRSKAKPDQDLAFLPYSSGTTGRPKGVMLVHSNITSCTVMNYIGEQPNMDWGTDIFIGFLPFFHIYGLTVLIHQAFYVGHELVVMPKFEIEKFCEIIQEHKVTMAYVVPPVVLALSKHPAVSKYDLSSLRMMNSGAAPLTRELVEAVWNRLGKPVKQGYGLSETSPTTHMQPWDRWWSAIGSCGVLLPNMTAKYMSEEEKEVATGEVGELWMKGPNVFVGYLNNAEGTKNALTGDGYFKTGDVGYQDKDGNFYITDRVKELIKYKGFQVPPAELEGILQAHPKIADVAVIGINDREQATEVPLAFVVLNQGIAEDTSTGKEIADWLATKVANHKKLRGGVKFVKEIPKSASGKILRRLLKDQVLEGQGSTAKAKL